MTAIETTPQLVQKSYARTNENLAIIRKRLGRPLSFAAKILFGRRISGRARASFRSRSCIPPGVSCGAPR